MRAVSEAERESGQPDCREKWSGARNWRHEERQLSWIIGLDGERDKTAAGKAWGIKGGHFFFKMRERLELVWLLLGRRSQPGGWSVAEDEGQRESL